MLGHFYLNLAGPPSRYGQHDSETSGCHLSAGIMENSGGGNRHSQHSQALLKANHLAVYTGFSPDASSCPPGL